MNINCDAIVESEKLLQNVIQKLGWSDEFLTQRENYVQCPFDKNHWISNKNNQSHISYCKLRNQGYQKDEIKAMVPTIELIQSSSNESTHNWLNDPKWTTNLEVFSNTNIKRSRRTNDQINGQTKIETLASIRNSKRRRKSYRGIHTAKKSYTEILREIIAQQFEMLQSCEESIHSEQDPDSKREFSGSKYPSAKYSKYDKYENIPSPCSSRSKPNEDNSKFYEKNNQTYLSKSHDNTNNYHRSNYTSQHSPSANTHSSVHTHEKHKHSKHKHKKHSKHKKKSL